jgi:hypothetical protein
VQDATDRIIVSHQDGDRVVFSDSKELKDELEKSKVSINSLRNMVRSKGLVLNVGRSTGSTSGKRGRKAGVTWESLSAIGRIYEENSSKVFRYSGTLTSAQKMFLSRNGVKTEKLKVTKVAPKDAGGVP